MHRKLWCVGRSSCSGVAPGHGVPSALHAAEPAVYVSCCHLSLSASLFWCCASWDAAALSSFCLLLWCGGCFARAWCCERGGSCWHSWRSFAGHVGRFSRASPTDRQAVLSPFSGSLCKRVCREYTVLHYPRVTLHACHVWCRCVLLSWHTAADLVLGACTYTAFCMITRGGGGGQGVWGVFTN